MTSMASPAQHDRPLLTATVHKHFSLFSLLDGHDTALTMCARLDVDPVARGGLKWSSGRQV